MNGLDFGTAIGLIKGLGSPDPAVIESAVSDWLDDHPEATTTVQDGSITKAKLDSNLQGTVDDVADLKSQIAKVEDAVYEPAPTFVWEIGSIGSQSADLSSTSAIRTKSGFYYSISNGAVISVDSDAFQFAVAKYSKSDHTPFPRTSWGSASYTISDAESYDYRLVMRKTDQSTLVDTSISSHLIVKTYDSKIADLESDIADLDNELNQAELFIRDGNVPETYTSFEQGTITFGGTESDSTTRIRTGYIKTFADNVRVTIPEGYKALIYGYNAQKAYVDRGVSWIDGITDLYIPSFAYVRFTIKNASETAIEPSDVSAIGLLFTPGFEVDVVKYVATTGDDTNDGNSAESAYATIQHAIDAGGTTIIVGTGTYHEKIMAQNMNRLSLVGSSMSMFVLDNSEILSLSADGTTGLLKASKIFASSSNWYAVFIAQSKAPIRTGTQTRTYNVILWEDDAKLEPVLSLAACQATSGSFYYDGTNVYVNNTKDNATYRYLLYEDTSMASFQDINSLYICNMTVKYSDDHSCLITRIKDAKVVGAVAAYSAYGGGFRTLTANCTFVKCESYGMCSDGFGLSGGGNVDIKDCYAHDNGDDGVSHHTGCTGAVYGGEFAYNGKGGITPAYGAKIDISNVFCHDNRYGIYYINNTEHYTPDTNRMSCAAAYNNTDYDLFIDRYNVVAYLAKYTTKSVINEGNLIEIQ